MASTLVNVWSRESLAQSGFVGWVPFADLPAQQIPRKPGVYVVYRTPSSAPGFLASSAAGWKSGEDPSVPVEELAARWVDGASLLYIGKADANRRGLADRLRQYRRHGEGHNPSHWGGRQIWQLVDHRELLVAWMETPERDPGEVEDDLRRSFVADYGRPPFANLSETRQTRRRVQN